MSVRISSKTLSEREKTDIYNDLCLTPKLDYFVKKQFPHSTPASVKFYLWQDPYLYIPFFYGKTRLESHIVWDLSLYYKCSWTMSPAFKYRVDERVNQAELVKESFTQLSEHGTTYLDLFPGAGKTVISACLASCLEVRTLILFSMKTLNIQWKKTFDQFTNAHSVIFEGDNVDELKTADVIISMYTQLHKIKDILPTIGCLVIDEAHRMCTNDKIGSLLSCNPMYVICCSATPERNNGMDVMMKLISGSHKVSWDSVRTFTCYRLNVGIPYATIKNVRGETAWSETLNMICNDESRIYRLSNFLVSLCMKPGRIIAVGDRVKMLEEIMSQIDTFREAYPEYTQVNYDYLFGTKKKCSERKLLLGTIKKIGTAFDETTAIDGFSGQPASVLVIMSPFKDINLLKQVVGRVRDRSINAIIYDCVDDNPSCERQWKQRQKWYRDNSADVIDMELPEPT